MSALPTEPGTPSPSEEERQAREIIAAVDFQFACDERLRVGMWNDPNERERLLVAVIRPRLRAYARAARKAELEELAKALCSYCRNDHDAKFDRYIGATLVAGVWTHPHQLDEWPGWICRAPRGVHDRLAALAQEEQEAGH